MWFVGVDGNKSKIYLLTMGIISSKKNPDPEAPSSTEPSFGKPKVNCGIFRGFINVLFICYMNITSIVIKVFKFPLRMIMANDWKMKLKLHYRRGRHFVLLRVIVLKLNMICYKNFLKTHLIKTQRYSI